ncbi:unnamed protein product [Ilex paraguariensis]|uniref:Uncharacterized protein n=1 Tax=Ilex paraguariensis TaxID=185542 RepID=A0ABC8RP68_9AQUA
MCDCVSSTLPAYCFTRTRKLGVTSSFNWRTRIVPIQQITARNSGGGGGTSYRNGELQLVKDNLKSSTDEIDMAKSETSANSSRNSSSFDSEEYDFYGELGFTEREKRQIHFETGRIDGEESENSATRKGFDIGHRRKQHISGTDGSASSGVDFLLEFNENDGRKSVGGLQDEELARIEGSDGVGSKLEESEKHNVRAVVKSGRQFMRRSSMIAKQVISMQSALSLGFVSQLWVETFSWVVLVVEVRPSLLSGELERFLLEDVSQVGDVVLIEEESVMETEIKLGGLETLDIML